MTISEKQEAVTLEPCRKCNGRRFVWLPRMSDSDDIMRLAKIPCDECATPKQTEPLATLQSQERTIAELLEAAQNIIDRKSGTYKSRNGREMGIQGDDGEKCWIVHSDEITALEGTVDRARKALGGNNG